MISLKEVRKRAAEALWTVRRCKRLLGSAAFEAMTFHKGYAAAYLEIAREAQK